MRETSETPNDVSMQLCPAGKIRIAERTYKHHGALLVGQVFGMLKGEIEEQSLGRRDLLIESARNRAFGHAARERVSCESIGFGTKHVAWKLIEHDDKRERRFRCSLPASERSRGSVAPQRLEAGRDLGIERRVLFEPL